MMISRPKRLYDRAVWKRFRAQVLRERPLCELHLKLGQTVAATECDHRVALKDGGEALDPLNIAVLCRACHSSKTAHQDGAFGNKRKTHAPIKGCDAQGRPLDERHWWNAE